MPEIQVKLPPLHAGRDGKGGQVEIDQCTARFIVVLCGRRWGKTTYGIYKCLKGIFTKPGVYWWVAPIYPEAMIGWRMIRKVTRDIPGVIPHETDRYLEFPNGGQFWVKSADNPDSLRGEGLSGVVLDEMAQIKEAAWTQSLRPALADKKGWALFIGTPKGQNWVYRLWRTAEKTSNWAVFKKPSVDNPYLDPAEIEQARWDMSENEFRQEFEADFGASQYLVYPDFDRSIHRWKWSVPPFVNYFGGLDFGGTSIGSHKSAGIASGLTANDEVIIFDTFKQSGANVGERQLDWMAEVQQKINRIDKLADQPKHTIYWRADRSQIWGIQQARSLGHFIAPSKGGADSVAEGVSLVARRLQIRNGRPRLFYMPGLEEFVHDIEFYRYPEPEEGRPQPKNPLKVNDDLMDALRYDIEGVDFAVMGDPMKLFRNVLPVIGGHNASSRRQKVSLHVQRH